MAEQNTDKEDKTEDATPERRDDFREKGQIANSAELSQVAALAATVVCFGWYGPQVLDGLRKILIRNFQSASTFRVDRESVFSYFSNVWMDLLQLTLPLFFVAAVVGVFSTLLQTQFNWSWEKLNFNWGRLNPFPGMARMVKMEALVGLLKASAKLIIVSLITWLILKGEWIKVSSLLNVSIFKTWAYWGDITTQLLWGVVGLMIFVSGADYIYTFISLENQMKMSKEEVKEETKQRESDPHVKAKLRRMARDIANRKTIENTKKATVLITNPTHYSIAVRYELGMPAPIIVAKGVDFLALKMRETAKDLEIPIVENKPLARALYASVKEGEEVPTDMYKAIAEIIRFVFKLKGVQVTNKTQKGQTSATPNNLNA
ncbi:MAG: EscU/YscU/HrcU family type III secretion system export apparatus switch protein [Proteobacteria bacterium]|nr:EscU/YscU/HrcU family type III secretion system export apparatus switch protein [Pseudomonadota bacterium]